MLVIDLTQSLTPHACSSGSERARTAPFVDIPQAEIHEETRDRTAPDSSSRLQYRAGTVATSWVFDISPPSGCNPRRSEGVPDLGGGEHHGEDVLVGSSSNHVSRFGSPHDLEAATPAGAIVIAHLDLVALGEPRSESRRRCRVCGADVEISAQSAVSHAILDSSLGRAGPSRVGASGRVHIREHVRRAPQGHTSSLD